MASVPLVTMAARGVRKGLPSRLRHLWVNRGGFKQGNGFPPQTLQSWFSKVEFYYLTKLC